MYLRSMTRPFLMLVALCLALPSQAQPLIDQVPDEAALYVGWRGANDMGPEYEGSNMQGVIEQTGLLEAIPQLVDAIQKMSAQEDVPPEAAAMLSMGGTLWQQMWSNGGCMYMLPPLPDGPPIPRLAIIWNKGKDVKPLADSILDLEEFLKESGQVPVTTGEIGNAMFLAINFDPKAKAFKSLKTNASYKQAVGQVNSDGALLVYVDVKQWIGQVDNMADMMKKQAAEWDEKDPFAEVWLKVRDISGLAGVNRLMVSAGIKDKNWQTQMYLDAPAPRVGVLSLIDNKPIKPENLLHVPKTATYLSAFTIEPGKMLDVTRQIMGAIEPGMVRQMDKGLAEATEEVGVDIENKLIKGLGPVWSLYVDPMIAGNGFSSMVFVNELKDAKGVEEAFAKLAVAANEAMQMPGNAGIQIKLLTQEYKGVKITHLGIPYVAPSYTIHKGKLYLSLFPQGLEMAIDHSGKKADSILANETFNKTIGQFGIINYSSVSFTDLPETVADGYGTNLMIMQTIGGFSEMISGKPSPARMPPVGKVLPFIQPAGALSWVDNDGLHMHSIEPFPGSALMGPVKGMESTMAVSGPLAIAILLPALGSAREAAFEVQGMAQGRQVAMMAMAYSAENKGILPEDIFQLEEYGASVDVLITPRSIQAEPVPGNFAKMADDQKAAFIRKNSSFVLIPAGHLDKIETPSETILLFQRPDDTPTGEIVVLFADGHAEKIDDLDAFATQLKEQTGKTVAELIQRQENFKP